MKQRWDEINYGAHIRFPNIFEFLLSASYQKTKTLKKISLFNRQLDLIECS